MIADQLHEKEKRWVQVQSVQAAMGFAPHIQLDTQRRDPAALIRSDSPSDFNWNDTGYNPGSSSNHALFYASRDTDRRDDGSRLPRDNIPWSRYAASVYEAKWTANFNGHGSFDERFQAERFATAGMNAYEALRNTGDYTPSQAFQAVVKYMSSDDFDMFHTYDGLGNADVKGNILRRALTTRWGFDLKQDQNFMDMFHADWSQKGAGNGGWAAAGDHPPFDESYWG